jgi:hypothetical protein
MTANSARFMLTNGGDEFAKTDHSILENLVYGRNSDFIAHCFVERFNHFRLV